MSDFFPSVKGLDLLYLDGCIEEYERYLSQLGDAEREIYLKYQRERLELITKERKENEIEKEKAWKQHKRRIKSYSKEVDRYYERVDNEWVLKIY